MLRILLGFLLVTALTVTALTGCGGSSGDDAEDSASPAAASAAASPASPAFSPSASASPPQASATAGPLTVTAEDRLRIPRIGVDAPLAVGPLDSNGRLPNPVDANTAMIYDFSTAGSLSTPVPYRLGGSPAAGLLAVYGYLSRPEQGRAVFYDLPTMVAGDQIEVLWQGRSYQYTVVSRCYRSFVPGDDAAAVYRTTDTPTLLLHTHAGRQPSTNPNQSYGYGLVLIRAEQRPGSLSAACPPGESPDPATGLGGDQYGR